MLSPVRLLGAVSVATLLALAGGGVGVFADGPVLTLRGFLPMTASDGIPTGPVVQLPPADPSYCYPANPSASPPTRIFGTLTIGGVQAPAGTIVQVAFDGKAGPAAATTAAGGYKVDYDAGGASCANNSLAVISILVNGTAIPTGKTVGQLADSVEPFLHFDITVP